MEFKAVAMKPGTPHRLPIPCLNETQSCYVRGVVWDNWPWELDEASAGSVELDGTAADEELKQAVKWTRPEDSRAVPTGVRITGFNSQHKTLFRAEGSTPVDPVNLTGESEVTQSAPLLCANLELETRTSRVGKSHPHRAIFQFSRPAIPSEFRLALPQAGGLTRIIADEKEISFVRHGSDIILDPAAKPFSELVLEYRTEASPGWIVSRDEVVFPQLTCFVTEFAWHLVLDPERMLYRLPLTAAVSPREQPQTWERLLGPLARHSGESLFNPLSRADWKDLFNGTSRANSTTRSHDAWFVAAETPQQVIMKTWNLDVSHGLAWCGMLGSLVCGISLRRARRSWFRQSWIYLCGVWLVVAVFVAEPYAPIAGGAFLGSLLAIIVPRRFALGSDFLAEQHSMPHSPSGSAAIITGGLIALGINLLSPAGQGQETTPAPELVYFEIEEADTSLVVFDAAYRSLWDAWRELETGPAWLLKSSRYDVQPDTSGPPRITATYDIVVFGDSHPALLKLPLSGVSLDQVEGLIDGQPVRLIPAADRTGFLLPLAVDKNEKTPAPPAAEAGSSRPVVTRTITLKFRPLPLATNDDQESYSANIPPLPESVVVLDSERWRLTLDTHGTPIQTAPGLVRELGPIGHLDLSCGSPALSPRENLTDLQLRTLVECGPLGARVQIGALTVVPDPLSPTEYTLTLPAGLLIQSIVGPSLDQSEVGYSDKETLVTLRLRPIGMAEKNPIEITAFLPVTSKGFQLAPPRWKPDRAKQPTPSSTDLTADTRFEKSLVGVVAKPGFRIVDTSTRSTISPISPIMFFDSLFTGLVWNAPDMAWTCRDSTGPSWALETIASTGRGTLSQTITLKAPQSEWRLEAKISTAQGVPFEHVFTIDERIEIHRATVQQDGADRLLRWTRTGNQLRLSIRDGQPGTQTIQVEGAIIQGTGAWAPPECEYLSGQTIDSSVMIRNSSQVASTLRWSDSTTRLRPNAEQSDEEVRYRPGTPAAPLTIRVDPVVEERSARIWVDLIPQRDRSWRVTLRAHLKENLPFVAPVRIVWDQPGLSEFRPTNSRDNVRQTSSGKGLLLLQSTKPTELSLSATIDQSTGSHHPIRLPQLSGVVWSEIWVSLPRGAGYRPARSSSALLSSAPSSWPAAWTENLTSSREDLYSCSAKEVLIETTSSEPLVRPVRAESLIWMEGAENHTSPIRVGVTKYLLIAERDITLEIPEAVRSMIRAVAIDGRTQAVDATIRVPSRSNDLSHEVVVWWQSGADTPELAPRDLIRFPGSPDFPHWTGVVPPHHQVLLEIWGRRTPLLHEFWLDRSESLLKAADEFHGAPWSVDGPLLHQLADSRDELHQANRLTPAESERQDQIDRRWKSFSQSGGSISSPPFIATTEMHYSGLDAILALCGESRSLWLSSDRHPYSGPRLLDRRWAIIITAALAALVSLLVLTWIASIFRRLDLAEKLAAHPNSTMVVLGLIWWAFLSPSVLGLGLALFGGWLSIRDRTQATRVQTTATANGPA